jgi:hypothetical protein
MERGTTRRIERVDSIAQKSGSSTWPTRHDKVNQVAGAAWPNMSAPTRVRWRRLLRNWTQPPTAFARRHQELASAIAAGRDWLGINHDSLPDRMVFIRTSAPRPLWLPPTALIAVSTPIREATGWEDCTTTALGQPERSTLDLLDGPVP